MTAAGLWPPPPAGEGLPSGDDVPPAYGVAVGVGDAGGQTVQVFGVFGTFDAVGEDSEQVGEFDSGERVERVVVDVDFDHDLRHGVLLAVGVCLVGYRGGG